MRDPLAEEFLIVPNRYIAALALATLAAGVTVVQQQPEPKRPAQATSSVTSSPFIDERAFLPPRVYVTRSSRERVVTPHVTAPVAAHRSAPTHPLVSRATSQRPATQPASEKVNSSGFTYTQLRIRSCESGPNGYATGGRALDYNYTEQNAHSTASGAWQFLDSTWDNFRGYHRAMYAPPAVQDEKARLTFAADGNVPWYASRSCWGS